MDDDATDRGSATSLRERWPSPTDDLRWRLSPTRPSLGETLAALAARLDTRRAQPSLTRRIETYWRWFAVILFVSITLDMLSTMYAFAAIGAGGEANPLIRWALHLGVAEFAAVNLVVGVAAALVFHVLVSGLRRSADRYTRYVEWGIQVWLGVLLGGGLSVVLVNAIVLYLAR